MVVETGIAKVNGTQLYYEVAGNGFPLVLIHGFLLDTRMWDDQFATFAQQYRVIRYDARSFGKSALPTQEPYLHADDLSALLNYLGITQAHIVGLSMGGGIGMDFAITYPETTRTLSVANPLPNGYSSSELDHSLIPIVERASTAGGNAANQLLFSHIIFAPVHEHPEASAHLKQILTENSGWHWVNEAPNRVLDPPVMSRLHEITAPTLIIQGERDMATFHEITSIMQQTVPNARMVVLPDVGHMCNMEAPELFNTAVLSFLQSKTN